MMLRDLLVTGIIVSLIPFSFFRPWVGILLWTWLSYMAPHRLAFGFAYDFPFALIVSITTLSGMLISKDRGSIPATSEVLLLALLWLVFFLSTTLAAFYPDNAWDQFTKVSKILIMTFATMMLIRSREQVTALLGVVAFSLGFFGFKGGIWALLTGGQNEVLGPSGSFISGNTEIGLALNMNLPILFFLRRWVQRRWLRLLMLATIVLSVVASLSTYSRGALLGLIATLAYLTWRSRHRLVTVLAVAAGLTLAVTFLPPEWYSRMQTIQTYQEDQSAMGRIHTWILSTRIAADRPFLGAGFRCFTAQTTMRYMPETTDQGFDAHNIFFQVLGEHGVTGLVVYVALLLATLASTHGLARMARRSERLRWLRDYAHLIQGSLLAYVVSGFFLSLSYFDLYFLLIAVAVILRRIIRAELRREASPPVPVGIPAAAAL